MAQSNNPRTLSEWQNLMRTQRLDPGKIKVSDISYRSASKLDMRMFLCLKILVGRHDAKDLDVKAIAEGAYRPPNFDLLKNVIDKCKGDGDPFGVKDLAPNLFSPNQFLTHLVLNSEKIEPDDGASKLTIFQQYLQKKSEKEAEKEAIAAMKALSVSNTPPPPGGTASASSSSASPVLPATPSSNPQAQYEAVVNMSLVVFLSSVRLHATAPGVAEYSKVAHWHPDPKAFILKNSQGQQLLQARVDGYLSRKGVRDALAILETKPFVRKSKLGDIERQEGAQMAAWIASGNRSKGPGVLTRHDERDVRRRVLISQDRHEIYVTIAEYDADYVHYITDGRIAGLPGRETPPTPSRPPVKKRANSDSSSSSESGVSSHASTHASSKASSHGRGDELGFLKMNVYGPFRIDHSADMKNLAHIVTHLCVALLA